jgi:hypothetical protein
MARPGFTETLDETYELAVYLERIDTIRAEQRASNPTTNPIGTCMIGLNRVKKHHMYSRPVKVLHPIGSFGERVFDSKPCGFHFPITGS